MGANFQNCTECGKDYLVSDEWRPETENPGYRIEIDDTNYITTRCEHCFDLNPFLTTHEKYEDPDTKEILEIRKLSLAYRIENPYENP